MAVNTSYHTSTGTDYKDVLAQLVTFATNDQVNTAIINAGGTGYVVGDIVTVSGGTSVVAATIRVTTEAAGVVTGIEVWNAGSYSVTPGATNVATTGGTGTGFTVDLNLSKTLVQ